MRMMLKKIVEELEVFNLIIEAENGKIALDKLNDNSFMSLSIARSLSGIPSVGKPGTGAAAAELHHRATSQHDLVLIHMKAAGWVVSH